MISGLSLNHWRNTMSSFSTTKKITAREEECVENETSKEIEKGKRKMTGGKDEFDTSFL